MFEIMKRRISTWLAAILVFGGTVAVLVPSGGTAYAVPAKVWGLVGGTYASPDQGESTSVTVDTYGTPYVAYSDYTNSGKATVRKYDGNVWVSVGKEGFSSGVVSEMTVAASTYGTPFVAYRDDDNGGQAAVRKYDGNAWVPVGNEGFSAGSVDSLSMSIDTDGTPYAAYADHIGNAAVVKYDAASNTWQNLSAPPIPTLALSLRVVNGTLYAVLQDTFSNINVLEYNGTSWQGLGSMFGVGTGKFPSIAADPEGNIYVAYARVGQGFEVAVMKTYNPNDNSWQDVGEEISMSAVQELTIAIDTDGNPYAAFRDQWNGNRATVMKYNGTEWLPVGSAGFSAGYVSSTSLYVYDGTPYVAYQDLGNDGKAAVMKLIDTSPSLTADTTNNNVEQEIEITFMDDGAWRSAITAVKDGAVQLAAGTDYTISAGKITFVAGKLDLGNHMITITARDYTDAEVDQFIKEAPDTSNTWQIVGRADFTAEEPEDMSLYVDNGTPFVAYQGNDYKAAVTRFDGNNGVAVGSAAFSSGEAYYISLRVDNGTPYVAFQDETHDYKATVMRYDGSDWQPVGNAGFSPGEAAYTSLYIDNGTPYVAFQDVANDYKATVMRYDGSNWELVGSAGFSPGGAWNTSLYVENGTPYMAFQDEANGYKASVMRYDGSNWKPVGSADISEGEAYYVSLFVENGTPYVAYGDEANDNKATVMKYDGSHWVPVGGVGLSSGAASFTSLYVDNGTPYLAYQDVANNYKATVKKYDGSHWVPVGSEASTNYADFISLFVENGTPYVAYHDWDNDGKATIMMAISNDNRLSALSLSSGALNPAFDSGTTDYMANVANNVASLTVTPTAAADARASVKVNGLNATSGQASGAINLNVGSNTITVTVTVQDGTTKDYTITVTRAASGNADLSGLTLSSGTLSPAFTKATTSYTSNVPNRVSNLTVTADPVDADAAITVNGTAVVSGQASEPINLNVGSNTITVVVTAPNNTTRMYTVTVTRAAPSSSNPPTNNQGGAAVPTEQTGSTAISVSINGNSDDAVATAASSEQDGSTVLTVTVHAAKLMEQLVNAADKPTVVIPATSGADKVSAVLTGDAVKAMENKNAVLEIQTPNGSYKLPASEMLIDQLSAQLGAQTKLSDMTFQVDIAKSDGAKVELVENAAAQGGFTLVVPPVDFTITATFDKKTVNVEKFNSYVEREIPLPDGTDASKITTAVVLNEDGTTRSVPTKIITRDGKLYAVVNSLTNSTYSVVWNPIAFKDVAQHWAKDAVDDMGSRMVISGTGNGLFSPDRDITRAEFAAIVVRGLGLKLDHGATPFTDVKSTDWYSGAIATAHSYQMINGFSDGTFHPTDKITREQAMVILSKAMTITKLKAKLPMQSTDVTLEPYKDASELSAWAKSHVADCVQAGIVSGRNGTQLAPKDYITRAEVAVMIERLLQKSELI